LNCIAGLMPLSSGTIALDDTRIDTLPPERRGFGMVFQNYALFPHMSVARNVGFGLRMRGVPAADTDRRVANALALVQLEGQEHKLPGQLSGGQQQRVAIARAIVIEPPLVLMDEPLSNLDAKLRLETRSEIRRIHRELGRATIYVTHDQDEALSLADRIVVMKDGVVQQIATPHEVYAEPANLEVARFMGYRNVFELPLEREEGGAVVLAGPDGRLVGTRKQRLDGKQAFVAIRPEEVVLGEGPGGQNTIAGRVENVEYAGRDSLVDLLTASGLRLYLRTSSPVAAGEAIKVHVPPARVLVYPR
jgi:putative spermidine/putrescine transport system ATP-binding protein